MPVLGLAGYWLAASMLPSLEPACRLQARTMRVFLLAAAAASALELSGDTFEAEVFGSGKNSFIKFLAPW